MPLSLNKQLLITTLFLVFTIGLFELTKLDILVQDYLYDFSSKTWFLDRDEEMTELIFYSGIKKLLILFAVAVLLALVFFRKKAWIQEYRQGLFVVLLSAILVPVVIGGLKAISNTPCPKNIEHYNGDYPNTKVFEKYPADFKQICKIKCWPAGHASGGFALLSLFYLFKTQKNKKRALIGALVVGWSMGTYKMLIGDHFLSHTIITMLIAWIVILLIQKSISKLR